MAGPRPTPDEELERWLSGFTDEERAMLAAGGTYDGESDTVVMPPGYAVCHDRAYEDATNAMIGRLRAVARAEVEYEGLMTEEPHYWDKDDVADHARRVKENALARTAALAGLLPGDLGPEEE